MTAAYEHSLTDLVLKGSPFASNIITHFEIVAVIDILVQKLASPNLTSAKLAAKTLADAEIFPSSASTIITTAITKNLNSKPSEDNAAFLIVLAQVASKINSIQSLRSIQSIVESNLDVDTRWKALKILSTVNREKVSVALHKSLKDSNRSIVILAAVSLAERRDTSVIPILIHLIETYHEFDSDDDLYLALAKFPHDPRVEPVIKAGLKSNNDFIRAQASVAMSQLQTK